MTAINGSHSLDVDPSPAERVAAQKQLLAAMIRLGTVWENAPYIEFYETDAGRRGVNSVFSVGEALISFLADIGVLTDFRGLVAVPEEEIDRFAAAKVDSGLDLETMIKALIYHGTCDNWLFPTTRAGFQLPARPGPIAPALVGIAGNLVTLGYLVAIEAQDGERWYIWTSRIEPAMCAAYEWDANGVSHSDRTKAWYRDLPQRHG
ncbi:MAG: hypothetical protein ACAH11_13640 [Sphingomonas sp.]